MTPRRIEIAPSALGVLREMSLFDRQPIIDFIEQARSGLSLTEDFGEVTPVGRLQSIVLIRKHSIAYVIDEEKNVMQIISIRPADL